MNDHQTNLRGKVNKICKANVTLLPYEQQLLIRDALGIAEASIRSLPPRHREALNEPFHRHALAARRKIRSDRKKASKFGGKGDAYRRIIKTTTVKGCSFELPVLELSGETIVKKFTVPDREFQLHATKGWRNYRITA